MDNLYFFAIYFMIKSLVTIGLYPILYYSVSYIKPHLEYSNKIYIVSNLIKGIMLLYLCLTYYEKFFTIFNEEKWDSFVYKKITVAYAVTDFCSLFIVSKMKLNTIIHHILVVLFTMVIVYQDIQYNTILYSIIIYGFFSSLAYMVNIFLALRFITSPSFQKMLCNIAYYMYVVCFSINLLYQILFISRNVMINMIPVVLYTIAISFLAYDDILLLKFLKNNK